MLDSLFSDTDERLLSKELNYLGFVDDGIMMLRDGSLMAGIRYQPTGVESKSFGQLNNVFARVHSYVSKLDEGAEEQSYVIRDRTAEPPTPEPPARDAHPRIRSLYKLRMTLNEEELAEALKTTCVRVVTYRPSTDVAGGLLTAFQSDEAAWKKRRRKQLTDALNQLKRRVMRLYSLLGEIDLTPETLDTQAFGAFLFRLLNPSRVGRHGVPSFENGTFVGDRLCMSPVEPHRDHLRIDGLYYRILTIKSLPRATHAAITKPLMELGFPCVFHAGVSVPGQSMVQTKLEGKSRIAGVLSRMPILGGASSGNISNSMLVDDAYDVIRSKMRGDSIFTHTVFTVATWAETKDELDAQEDEIVERVRLMEDAQAMGVGFATYQYWRGTLPGHLKRIPRKKLQTSEDTADLTPVACDGADPGDGPMLFFTRQQSVHRYDHFHPQLPAWNAQIVGETGSGKTYTFLNVLLQTMQRNPHVTIIDIGGLNQLFVDLLDGQAVDVTLQDVSTFNPFVRYRNGLEQSDQLFLTALLERLILGGDSNERFDHRKKQFLWDVVQWVANEHGRLDITLLFEALGRSDFARYGEEMQYGLKPWLPGQIYGALFEGSERRDAVLNDRLSYYNLAALSSNPDIQAVIILILLDEVRRMFKQKKGPKILGLDESWAHLRQPGLADMTDEMFRTARKYHGSVTTMSQTLYESAEHPGLIGNTKTWFMMRQDRSQEQILREVLKLNDREIEIVTNLRVEKGHFGECYLIRPNFRGVLRLYSTATDHWLTTSDPLDKERFEEAKDACGGDGWKALLRLAGVAGGQSRRHQWGEAA